MHEFLPKSSSGWELISNVTKLDFVGAAAVVAVIIDVVVVDVVETDPWDLVRIRPLKSLENALPGISLVIRL